MCAPAARDCLVTYTRGAAGSPLQGYDDSNLMLQPIRPNGTVSAPERKIATRPAGWQRPLFDSVANRYAVLLDTAKQGVRIRYYTPAGRYDRSSRRLPTTTQYLAPAVGVDHGRGRWMLLMRSTGAARPDATLLPIRSDGGRASLPVAIPTAATPYAATYNAVAKSYLVTTVDPTSGNSRGPARADHDPVGSIHEAILVSTSSEAAPAVLTAEDMAYDIDSGLYVGSLAVTPLRGHNFLLTMSYAGYLYTRIAGRGASPRPLSPRQ